MSIHEEREGELFYEGKWYVRASHLSKDKKEFENVEPSILKNKGRIGTEVHSMIEDYINGKFFFTSEDTEGYFHSFKRWYDFVKPKYRCMEERYFCNDMDLTGQIDGIIEMSDGLVILDYKTSAAVSPSWIKQAHYYYHLAKKNNLEIEPRMLFLKLDKSGKNPQVIEYKYSDTIMRWCNKRCLDFHLSKIIKK